MLNFEKEAAYDILFIPTIISSNESHPTLAIRYFSRAFTNFIMLILFLRHRNEGKYRDLLIIFVLSACLVGGIQFSNYQQYQTSLSQNAQIVRFLQTVSHKKNVSLKKLKTNKTVLTDKMILKINQRYYQVDFDSDFSSYHLQRAQIINNQEVK